jgi:hypothetical protein
MTASTAFKLSWVGAVVALTLGGFGATKIVELETVAIAEKKLAIMERLGLPTVNIENYASVPEQGKGFAQWSIALLADGTPYGFRANQTTGVIDYIVHNGTTNSFRWAGSGASVIKGLKSAHSTPITGLPYSAELWLFLTGALTVFFVWHSLTSLRHELLKQDKVQEPAVVVTSEEVAEVREEFEDNKKEQTESETNLTKAQRDLKNSTEESKDFINEDPK